MRRYLLLLAMVMAFSLPGFSAWTSVQYGYSYCNATASCVVTMSSSVTAGHLLVAFAWNSGTQSITTVSGGGTWTHPASCQATVSGFQTVDTAYSLAATSGTSITLNFSANTAFADVIVVEYSGGVAPFTFDACALGSGTTTSVGAGSITTTGANELAVAAATSQGNFPAGATVSPAPWAISNSYINGSEILGHALGLSAGTTQAIFTATAANPNAGVTIAFKDSTAALGVRKRVNAIWRLSDAQPTGGTSNATLLAQIVADTFSSGSTLATNEENPEGFPSTSAAINDGNNPCASVTPCNTTMGMTYWGATSAGATGGNSATNWRVNVRNCHSTWYSSATHQWTELGPYQTISNSDLDEEEYTENYSGGPFTSDRRQEADGSVSWTITSGRVGHYFGPFPRPTFLKTEFAGVVNYCEMRLIVNNAGATDDRASANIVGSVGGDFYPGATTNGIANNNGIGGGKAKKLSSSWRSFGFSTLTLAQINALPAQPTIHLNSDVSP